MKLKIKKFIGSILVNTGFVWAVRKAMPVDKLTVLMYHKVDPKHFEKQIIYLKKHYNPISEKELYENLYGKKPLPKNSVMLTFDDGYYNNYLHAYPILKKHNVPATIFLTTSLIGTKNMAWFDKVEYVITHTKKKSITFNHKRYFLTHKNKKRLLKKYYIYSITATNKERVELFNDLLKQTQVLLPANLEEKYLFMTWQQAKEMTDLISFGAHTHTHPILPNCTEKELIYEIKKSKETIQKKLQITPLTFCYPNGDYNRKVIDVVKNNGFKIGFSSKFGRNDSEANKFSIKRIGANIRDDKNILACKLLKVSDVFKKSKLSNHFKVVHISNYYYPQQGGITASVHKLVKTLQKEHIPTSVVAYPQAFRKIEDLSSNGATIHRILVIFFLAWTTIYLFVNKIIYRKVIAHSHSANFCALAGLIGQRFGVKTIHTFRTDLKIYKDKTLKAKKYIEKIDTLVAVSDYLAKDYKEKFKISKKIITAYNGHKFGKLPVYKKPTNVKKILFVGNFLPIKNPLLFIKAIQIVGKKTPVQAQMIGDGELKNKMKEYIEKHDLDMITFLGYLDNEKVKKTMARNDVLALTSHGEGFGNVLIEAITQGTAIVSTNCGGPQEIIENKKTGVLVDSNSPEKLANAILYAIKHKETLRKNAFAHAKKKFSYETNMKRYKTLYRRLVLEKPISSSEYS